MKEPVKKRLVGGLVIAAVGGLALSFVLHDSHPTYTEALRAENSEPLKAEPAVLPSPLPLKKSSAGLSPLALPKTNDQPLLLTLPSSLSSRQKASSQATCHYNPGKQVADCGGDAQTEEKPAGTVQTIAPIQPKPKTSKPVASKPKLLQVVPPKPASVAKKAPKPHGDWLLQVASFREKANALHLISHLKKQHVPVHVSRFQRSGSEYYRVTIGPGSRQELQKWQQILVIKEQLRGYIVKK